MRYDEIFKTATVALRANKVRSALTIVGVVIGVGSVVTLISIGNGLQSFITERFNALGSNLVLVAPGNVDFGDDPAKYFSRNQLSDKHVELIELYASEHIVDVSPSIRLGEKAKFKTKDYSATLIGANSKGLNIFNFEIDDGRSFTRQEVNSKDKVAILGVLVYKELFGTNEPIGKKIKLGEDTYEVIGTFKEKGLDFDDTVVVPYTSLQETFEIEQFTNIATKAINNDSVRVAKREIELALLRDLKEDEFTVLSQDEILGSIQDILGILTIGLGAIAGISLLVGGIGIMNIMLVSVTERTREIGLRKALGATNNVVALQFLTESILLSVFGGIIGILLGWGGAVLARQFVNTSLPVSAVILAFGFAFVVGVVFGTYPAIQASKKNPIEALRYE